MPRRAKTYLFSYGSNNPRQLAERLGHPVDGIAAYAPGLLRAFRGWSQRWNGGVATLIKGKRTDNTYGYITPVTAADLAVLDRYEGVASGNYYRQEITVVTDNGDVHQAIAYIASSEEKNRPSSAYLRAVAETIGAFWEGENGPVTARDITVRNNPNSFDNRFGQREKNAKSRSNPLHDYYARPLGAMRLIDMPSTARGPWTKTGMEQRFRDAYAKVPLDLDVYLDYFQQGRDYSGEHLEDVHEEALAENKIVLYIDVSNSAHDYRVSRDEALEDDPSGATIVSPLTPFMLLHNFYECLSDPDIAKASEEFQNYLARVGFVGQIQTKAGLLNRLQDPQNAAADLFAAYLMTGRIKHANPETHETIERFFMDLIDVLRSRPGVYIVQTIAGQEGRLGVYIV